MAKTFGVNSVGRIANAVMTTLIRRGVRIGGNVLLTVPGRTSGEPRTTPVTILDWNGERWLQSPYGEVNWVRNLRAAGGGTLTRGRHVEPIVVVELTPAEAAPVYKGTLATFPSFIRNYFDVTPESPLEAFESEARRHPMFRLVQDT